MPSLDLSDGDGGLNPLAACRVLAVMCHPADIKMRERMLAPVQKATEGLTPRRSGLDDDEFMREVQLRANRGILAGGLLLTLLQLHENGYRHSLNRAIPLIAPLLDRWQQPASSSWTPDCHVSHVPHSRRKVLGAFNDFLKVAHLWAALVHGGQHQRDDIWPGSIDTLPCFLGYSEAFASKAAHLPWPGRQRRFTLPHTVTWHFRIPDDLRDPRSVVALPLTEEQESILRDYDHA